MSNGNSDQHERSQHGCGFVQNWVRGGGSGLNRRLLAVLRMAHRVLGISRTHLDLGTTGAEGEPARSCLSLSVRGRPPSRSIKALLGAAVLSGMALAASCAMAAEVNVDAQSAFLTQVSPTPADGTIWNLLEDVTNPSAITLPSSGELTIQSSDPTTIRTITLNDGTTNHGRFTGSSPTTLTLSNVELTGGVQTGTGGAIYVTGLGQLTINVSGTVKLTSNTSLSGGAIGVSGNLLLNGDANSIIELSGNTSTGGSGAISTGTRTTEIYGGTITISDNRAATIAGAIAASDITISGTTSITMDGNSAGNVGGAIRSTGVVTISGGTVDISGNKAIGTLASNGGAIWTNKIQDSPGTVSAVTIDGSRITLDSNISNADQGGAIFSRGSVAIGTAASVVQLTNNTSAKGGGAIEAYGKTGSLADGATVSISGSSIEISGNSTGQSSPPSVGGAIYVAGDAVIGNETSDVTISRNQNYNGWGGAILASGAVTIDGSTVTLDDNHTTASGGAIYGGANGVTIGNSASTVTMTNNTATFGGAVYSVAGVTILGRGITISGNSSTGGNALTNSLAVTLDDSVTTVDADDGGQFEVGGVIVAPATATGAAADPRLTRAGSTSYGGAIYGVDVVIGNADGSSTLAISGNSATYGGAILSEGSTTLTGHGEITNNTASRLGGAIQSFGDVTVNAIGGNLTFSGNTEAGQPNAIWLENADPDTGAPAATPVTATFNAATGSAIIFYDPIANEAENGLVNVVASGPGTIVFDGAKNANESQIYGNTTVESGIFAVRNNAIYGMLLSDVDPGLGQTSPTSFTVNPGATLAGGIQGEVRSDNFTLGGTLDISGSTALGHAAGTASGGYSNFTITSSNVNFAPGSRVLFNTYLNDGGKQLTDMLTLNLNGGQTSGTASVIVTNTGGLGAVTLGDGIQLVQTNNGTSIGAFTLGNRVAAGAYNYLLYQGGVDEDAGNQNWYLRSSGIRPEVPLDTVATAAAAPLGLAMLGTATSRDLSPGQFCADGAGTGNSGLYTKAGPANVSCNTLLWGRLLGQTGSSGGGGNGGSANSGFGSAGPAYSFTFGGFQAGADLYRSARDSAGLYAGAASMQSDVRAADGGLAGHLTMDAYGFGAYWTHRSLIGWYSDLVLQGNLYENINTRSVTNVGFGTQGWGLTASAETGYQFALGDGYSVIPQGQLIYQRTSIDGGADRFGLINYDATDEIYGRLGARLARGWPNSDGRSVTTWAETSFWHQFGSDAKTTFTTLQGTDPTTISSRLGGTWAQLRLGVTGQLTQSISIFGDADYNVSLDDTNGHSVGGRAGLRVSW